MGVTVKIANHTANRWPKNKVVSRESLLAGSCPAESQKCKRIIQTSLSTQELGDTPHITPSKNGFVYAAYEAYSGHHHLTIRPDDIWFAILSQLNFFINAHAEELRSHFVAHEGKKELVIVAPPGATMETYDFGVFARQMTLLIQENVVDPDLRDWMMPTFSTTKVDDRTVAAVLMMGSLQAYFSYTSMMICGIPSVTLLGEVGDYEDILQRLDKLQELGVEPAAFADLLRPVLRGFIATFDQAQAASTHDFWSKIAHYQGGSGMSHLSGWLTAFCFWRGDGKSMYRNNSMGNDATHVRTSEPDSREVEMLKHDIFGDFLNFPSPLVMGGVCYPTVDMTDIPNGWAAVPVKVIQGGHEYSTRMVAGSLGILATTSEGAQEERKDKVELDSIRSFSGWLMYEL